MTSLSAGLPSQKAAFASEPLLVSSVHEKKKKNLPVLQKYWSHHNYKCNLSASQLLKKKNPGQFHLKDMCDGRIERFIFVQTLPQGLTCLLCSKIFLSRKIIPTSQRSRKSPLLKMKDQLLSAALARFAEDTGKSVEMAIPNLHILMNLALRISHYEIL